MITLRKHLFALTLLVATCYAVLAQNAILTGTVQDTQGEPIEAVSVMAHYATGGAAQSLSDKQGHYTLSIEKPENLRLVFQKEDYQPYYISINYPASESYVQIGSVTMELLPIQATATDLAAFLVEELESSHGEGASLAPMLSASRDPFNGVAGYQFSPMRFRARGYDAQYQPQYLNGLQMNDMNSGWSQWALWNGLNNAVVNQEQINGLNPASFTFGNVGGAVNISTRASLFRAGTRLTYSLSNRTYNHRVMATYATGLRPNGWALALSVSRRWGNHGYVMGQFYDAYGYFLGLEKQFSRNHAIMLTVLAAPTQRGVASASTQEAYDLAGGNYYNPNIGMQNGRWRNARVKNNHEPLIQLQHMYKWGDIATLTTAVGYRFGYNAYSALNWNNAPDPRPDYYRYLPSYYGYMTETPDEEMQAIYRDLWRGERNIRYINWESMYDLNRNNYQHIYDAEGKLLAEGRRSEYVVEDRRQDQKQWNAATNLNLLLNDVLRLDMGAHFRHNRTANFNVLKDLLGGDFWYDIDKFSERDFPGDPSKAQPDLNNPHRIVREGDIYGHNYIAATQNGGFFTTLSYSGRYLEAFLSGDIGATSIWREGRQRRGLFPDNSYGRSDVLTFINGGGKLGMTYKITGHHFLSLNGAFMQEAPYFRQLFISPRTRSSHVNNPRGERIASADISYNLRSPYVKARVTLFYTHFWDGMRSMNFYDDGHRAFSNYIVTGVDRRHMGLEAGAEVKITPALTVGAVFTTGQYRYANNPEYLQTVDNNEQVLEQARVYWKGFHVSGTPQTAANINFRYNTPFYLYFGMDANYFGRTFIDINPVIRTDKGRAQLADEFISQERFKGGFTLDANAGYSWRIKHGTFLRINLSVTNILNNKNMKSGGYEQLRIRHSKDGKMMRPFDSRYFYMYGTNFFLNLSLQF